MSLDDMELEVRECGRLHVFALVDHLHIADRPMHVHGCCSQAGQLLHSGAGCTCLPELGLEALFACRSFAVRAQTVKRPWRQQ
jgi:hypothetical protein